MAKTSLMNIRVTKEMKKSFELAVQTNRPNITPSELLREWISAYIKDPEHEAAKVEADLLEKNENLMQTLRMMLEISKLQEALYKQQGPGNEESPKHD